MTPESLFWSTDYVDLELQILAVGIAQGKVEPETKEILNGLITFLKKFQEVAEKNGMK